MLGPGLVEVAPVVRSGQRVTMTVSVGQVRASVEGVASGSGQVGDEIRVVRQDVRRPIRARITGPGEVEVLP
jgi:flagella basal body P-ring formation protein FlgA